MLRRIVMFPGHEVSQRVEDLIAPCDLSRKARYSKIRPDEGRALHNETPRRLGQV